MGVVKLGYCLSAFRHGYCPMYQCPRGQHVLLIYLALSLLYPPSSINQDANSSLAVSHLHGLQKPSQKQGK